MKQSTVVVTLIVALVSLTACARNVSTGSSSDAPSATPSDSATVLPLPNATYTGPIGKASTMSAAGVTLDVPTAQAKISWEQAYVTCKSGDAVCDTKSPAVISLASATSPATGQISGTDSSIVPLMKQTLVYVITQVGVPCSPNLPPAVPSAEPTTPPIYSCTFVNFIDATNGKVLYSTQGPTADQ